MANNLAQLFNQKENCGFGITGQKLAEFSCNETEASEKSLVIVP